MVESSGLLNRRRAIKLYRGFESPPLRQLTQELQAGVARMVSVLPWRRIFWSLVTVAAICVALCGLAGAVLCESALHPPRRSVPSNASALTVQVTARDGIVLRAWLFQPEKSNGDAVLILHGIADSRASQVGLAGMFLAHGYAVLVPDSRSHGESGGDIATYGLLESDDVHRWVSWLIDDRHPRHVFGLGESLGAAVLIQALRVEPRFSAIVADSAFSSFERIARDRVAARLPFPPGIGRALAAPPVWAGIPLRSLALWLGFPRRVAGGRARTIHNARAFDSWSQRQADSARAFRNSSGQ